MNHPPGRRRGLAEDLQQAVFESAAVTERAARLAAAAGGRAAGSWEPYAAKVRDHSWQVTNADIGQLTAAGHSEDEIFEITVAAALGTALRSLNAGLRAVRGETGETP